MTTNNQKCRAAKQVLTEAADAPYFLGLSDAERLIWMLEKAFELGRESTDSRIVRRSSSRPLSSDEQRHCPPRSTRAG
jgi:hypothetical protein